MDSGPISTHPDPPATWFHRAFKPIGAVPVTLSGGGTREKSPSSAECQTKQSQPHLLPGSATGSDERSVHAMTIYRDATIPAPTIELLRESYSALNKHGYKSFANAVADVIERWDANDATEFEQDDEAA